MCIINSQKPPKRPWNPTIALRREKNGNDRLKVTQKRIHREMFEKMADMFFFLFCLKTDLLNDSSRLNTDGRQQQSLAEKDVKTLMW